MKTPTQIDQPVALHRLVRRLFYSKVPAIIMLWSAGCHAGQFLGAEIYGDPVSPLDWTHVVVLTIVGVVTLYSPPNVKRTHRH